MTLFSSRSSLLAAPLCALVLGGAYCPNTNALYAKVVEECRVVPVIPSCAQNTGDDVFRFAVEQGLARAIDNPIEEQCVMDVDCSEADSVSTQELIGCFTLTPSARIGSIANNQGNCFSACSIELSECGAAQTGCWPSCPGQCDHFTVDACFRQSDTCKEWCDLTLNNGTVRNADAQARAEELALIR
jgi:hypothetical protein